MSASAASVQHPESIDLSREQEQHLLGAVAGMIRETAYGQPVTPLPAALGDLIVSGTFVSLKRGKHLRGCCGGLQPQPVLLGGIIPDAVQRTVLEDPRFPPVSPTELPYLDVEVWLLCNPQRVKTKGEERVRAVVTGGKHGVVVRWGEQRGLLLPGVAAEHEWDATTFLDHVCLKAGLHPSRWSEDDTHLMTFEGASCRGPVGGDEPSDEVRFLSAEQIADYADFCRQNLAALLLGGTPRYTAPGLPDATICGIVLSLDFGTGEKPWQVSKLDLRQGMALQASLLQLTQAAAQNLVRLDVNETDSSRLELAILYDPALHGTVAEIDLRGIDPRRRAVFVNERGRSGLVFDTSQAADEVLREAAEQLPVKDPHAGAVFSMAADVSQPRFVHAVQARPRQGAAVRPAAVAGAFYPADPKELQSLVDELLGPEQPKGAWPAAMVPHAGLRYSGKVAGAVLRRLAMPSTVIILGPKHTAHGVDWAVAPNQQWSIPGVQLAADPGLAQQLVEAIPGLTLDAAAHAQEHGIEVELPFLARLVPQSRIVGIAVSGATYAECQQFAEGLADVMRRQTEPPLLLISSDMNHFASDAATRRLDELALACIDRLDSEALYNTCRARHISMCGMIPAVIVMETLRLLGKLERAERVAYATTADTTGDPGRVVGYAGMVFGELANSR